MSASTTKILGKYNTQDVLLIKAVTNLHVGVGGATKPEEVVDLPIQRDWLGFPTIYGSGLKGSLKSAVYFLYDKNAKKEKEEGKKERISSKCFGPDPFEESSSSPTLITDAYLLAFPARSLKGVYVYVTCPILLKRFLEYLKLVNKTEDIKDINNVISRLNNITTAVCENVNNIAIMSKTQSSSSMQPQPESTGEKKKEEEKSSSSTQAQQVSNYAMINETLIEVKQADDNLKNFLNTLKSYILDDASDTHELLIVDDETCLNLVNKSLIRVTRIRIDRDTKTVQTGGLWTEEYVPPNTVFFAMLLSDSNTKVNNEKTCVDLLREEIFSNAILPIGGRETIGSGLVMIKFLSQLKASGDKSGGTDKITGSGKASS